MILKFPLLVAFGKLLLITRREIITVPPKLGSIYL